MATIGSVLPSLSTAFQSTLRHVDLKTSLVTSLYFLFLRGEEGGYVE
jgi:hypothetical protein